MATEQNFTGFEFGDVGELVWGTGGSVSLTSVGTSSPRSGAFVLNKTAASGNTTMSYFAAGDIVGTSGTVTSGNHKRVSVRAYFRVSNPQNNGQQRIFGFGDDNGSCTVWYGAQTVGGFVQSGAKIGLRILTQSHDSSVGGAYPWGTVDLTASVWYRLLLDVDLDVTGTTVLSATLRITTDSDTPAIDFTLNNSLNIGATDNLDKLGFGYSTVPGAFGKRIDVDWDDVVYMGASDADAAAQPSLPAQTHIYAIVPPTGESLNQWTGTFADVDEYPLSGANTMSSSTALAEAEFTHASAIALGYRSFFGVKLYVNGLISGGGTGSFDYRLNGVVKNVTLTANYPGSPTFGSDPVGGILWQTLTAAQFTALTFGFQKQNSTQATFVANIGLEVLGTLATIDEGGTRIRGNTQIKPETIYDGQISNDAQIASHKVLHPSFPIFFGGGDDGGEGETGPPGQRGVDGAAGAAGAAGATGSAGLPGGALVLLASQTASASATLDFVSRNEGGLTGAIFQSDYDDYVFEFVNIIAATSTTSLSMRVSTNGGVSYVSSTDYRYAYSFTGSGGGTGNPVSNSATSIIFCGSLGNSTSQGQKGQLKIANPLSTAVSKLCVFRSAFQSSDNNWYHIHGAGVYNATTAVDAVRFLMLSGNITSGTIRCYGIAKTGTPIPAIITSAYASRSAAAIDGRLFMPSDGFTIDRDTSAAWVPWGPIYPFEKPSDTGFSWLNQGTSTLTDNKNGLYLLGPGSGNALNLTGRVKTAPATPYTVTVNLQGSAVRKNGKMFGLLFRQAGAGSGQNRLCCFFCANTVVDTSRPGWGLFVADLATPTTAAFGTFYLSSLNIDDSLQWFRMTDNGTNLLFYVSIDGQNWELLATVARAGYMLQGPDEYGFFVNTQNAVTPNLDSTLLIRSLKVT